ncbi:hypothetical protein V502_02992 [Pseudogymnoascus sp. VKM F-4520 (FW-2644)]|nr:hypothetical protein V502_02992 [Pseudogymnoascus sp. VKM F-4520 (FW-2644)]
MNPVRHDDDGSSLNMFDSTLIVEAANGRRVYDMNPLLRETAVPGLRSASVQEYSYKPPAASRQVRGEPSMVSRPLNLCRNVFAQIHALADGFAQKGARSKNLFVLKLASPWRDPVRRRWAREATTARNGFAQIRLDEVDVAQKTKLGESISSSRQLVHEPFERQPFYHERHNPSYAAIISCYHEPPWKKLLLEAAMGSTMTRHASGRFAQKTPGSKSLMNPRVYEQVGDPVCEPASL